MGDSGSITSRRTFLGVVAATPIAGLAGNLPTRGAVDTIPAPSCHDLDMPTRLDRSREGRGASRFRYHNAESFFRAVERGIVRDAQDRLYQTGIVLQLGLSSHLFDVGFTDEWCARHIDLYVTRSLAYANATGFGFASSEFNLLAAVLSPYGRWRFAERSQQVDQVPFTPGQMAMLTRKLLDHVHQVTGHPRPRGWRADHE